LLAAIACPWLIAGVIAHSTGLLVFAKTLDRLPVSTVVPCRTGLAFILVMFVSWWLFDEHLTFNQIAAINFIFIGLVVMTR
jgi:multidrug transporter EmrE-like cation transporter